MTRDFEKKYFQIKYRINDFAIKTKTFLTVHLFHVCMEILIWKVQVLWSDNIVKILVIKIYYSWILLHIP